ncbi:hypothetical protein AVEN_225059-1 [Araneus ventricosus]|uniref:Uncharacterized protein n=1 Tax=Araneus ventricosus TaxID=182803 RepID=A0A4Y2J9T2_ARAVE|nr:hypothetical protein AVEN_225059-1 [Araneus ventricosus]
MLIFFLFANIYISLLLRGGGGLVIRCLLWGLRAPGSKPDSTEDLQCIGPVARQIIRSGSNILPLVWCGSLERQVPARVSPSSSDHGLKLRGPSQNSPRVASKWDVNITKLISFTF